MQKAWVYLAHIFSSYPNDLFFRSNFELIFAFISFDLRGGYFNYFLLCLVNKFAFVAEIRNFYGAADDLPFSNDKWTQFEISLQELEGRKVVMGPEDVGVAQVTLESQEKWVLQVHVVAKDPEGDLEAL